MNAPMTASATRYGPHCCQPKVPGEYRHPTHCGQQRLSWRVTRPPWNMTFARPAKKADDGGSGRSRVPTDDRHKFGAERLHPATTNWCYRPIAAGCLTFFNDREVQEAEVRGGGRRSPPQRDPPPAAAGRTHALRHQTVVRLCNRSRSERRLY